MKAENFIPLFIDTLDSACKKCLLGLALCSKSQPPFMDSLMETSVSINRYVDSERRFQHVLEACGVFKSLVKLGIKEGDTVIVGEVCLLFLFSISVNCNPC